MNSIQLTFPDFVFFGASFRDPLCYLCLVVTFPTHQAVPVTLEVSLTTNQYKP